MVEKLIFIYNAKSGAGRAVLDSMHKIFSPKTYPCSLCQLTFSTFQENLHWKRFRESTTIPMQFLHNDEIEIIEQKIPEGLKLPVILLEKDGAVEVLLTKEELDQIQTVEELIETIQKKWGARARR